ncbi:MAG TPA: transcriptional regulator [Sphingobium sp.]|uniref:GbsR/MarR family transcriptional regulator n=1 Tax=Sphingobium sp. TaxID=1912891 RepID=UPI002ED240C8
MSKSNLTDQQRDFIVAIAALLVPSGMQPSTASLYGYLLLCPEPVSLDTIAADLGMAKSSASVAARMLEQYGLARRHGERGSKRVRYGVSERYSGFIAAQAALLGDIGRVIESRAGGVAADATLKRLRYLGSFYGKMERSIMERIQDLADEAIREGLIE